MVCSISIDVDRGEQAPTAGVQSQLWLDARTNTQHASTMKTHLATLTVRALTGIVLVIAAFDSRASADQSHATVPSPDNGSVSPAVFAARYCRIPLEVAEEPVVFSVFRDITESSKTLDETLEKNSMNGKWTYVLATPERGQIRVDEFMRIDNGHHCTISVIWTPKNEGGRSLPPPGKRLDDPSISTKINGHDALMTRYKEDDGTCSTHIELDKGAGHFDITLRGRDFDGPDNKAFKRVIEGINLKHG